MLDQILESALAAESGKAQAEEAAETETAEAAAEEATAAGAAKTAEEAAETETDPEDEPEAEETTKPDAPQTAAAARAEEEAIFDEKALATPEGQKALRNWARAQRAKFGSISGRLEKKQSRLAEKVREFAAERDQTRAVREQAIQYSQRVKGVLKRLTTGTAAEILSTFGELTGKEPAEFYREISHLMASNGKTNGKTSPETEAIKAELAELKRQAQERAAAETAAKEQAALDEAMDRIYSVAVSANAESKPNYPHIARIASADPARAALIRDHLAELKIKMHDAGTPISDEEAAQSLESDLAALVASSSPPVGTKSGQAPASGQAPPNPKPPKPTLTSKDRAAPAQRRERANESVEELAQDKSLMGAIFG